jgi:hypothetical protein
MDFYVDTKVSEEHTVSIFGPEDGASIYHRNSVISKQVYTAL